MVDTTKQLPIQKKKTNGIKVKVYLMMLNKIENMERKN